MQRRSLILLLLIQFFSFTSIAQLQKNILGSWEGKINIGAGLRIIFHFKENNTGGISASADSPDQSAFGLKCDTVILSGDNITIEMRDLRATFLAKLTTDSTLDGTFTQGATYPLLLKKGVGKLQGPNRPQTPQPPFPYKSEDAEYDNADKSLHYGATITIPEGKGPFPAALLITGSGPQNRDEELLGHKLFAVLADALTRNGFIVLRVDDRGVDKSTGKFAEATTEDFANDVNTSFNYLLSRSEVDKKKAGLIGHSEGGMIVPMVATKRNDIDFVVLLAAPGIRIDSLMAEQNGAILRSSGVSEAAVKSYLPLYKNLMKQVITAPDTATAAKMAKELLQKWKATTNAEILKELRFDSDESVQRVTTLLVEGFSGKWFKYFLAFNPQPYLEKLNCKVLALNGDKDIQVIASSNLAGIEASLKKSKSKKYSIQKLPGLNHLFQTCTTCTLQEYGELEETFSPAALKIINDWLKKYVK
ncbi:MAG: alpha/beta fold hydrolase [Chitinophagaceae bacterium]